MAELMHGVSHDFQRHWNQKHVPVLVGIVEFVNHQLSLCWTHVAAEHERSETHKAESLVIRLAALRILEEIDDSIVRATRVEVVQGILHGRPELRGAPEVLLDDLKVAFVRPDVPVGRIEATRTLHLPEVMGKPMLATALDRPEGSLAQRVQPEVRTADCHLERDGATTLMDGPRRPGVFFAQMIFRVRLILAGSHVIPEVEGGLSTAGVRDVNIPFFLILAEVQVAESGGQWRYFSATSDDLATSDLGRVVGASQKDKSNIFLRRSM